MAKRIRIFYMTQAAVAPPTFVLFTDRDIKLHFAFERFLEKSDSRGLRLQGDTDLVQGEGAECEEGRVRSPHISREETPVEVGHSARLSPRFIPVHL